jgi:5-methylcytosine-specific restriction endonuclease McrA
MNNINKKIMISEITKNEIWELRQENKTQPEISLLLGVSLASVSKWCKYFDPNGEFNKTHNIVYRNNIDKIIELYKLNNKLIDVINYFPKMDKRSVRSLLITRDLYKFKKKSTKRDKSLHVINWKKRKKIELVEYKGGKCVRCGYNKCIEALEFHHRNPKEKDFSISSNSMGFEKMKLESDKCDLLCANCHREEHYKNNK